MPLIYFNSANVYDRILVDPYSRWINRKLETRLIEQHELDTNVGKQVCYAATDV